MKIRMAILNIEFAFQSLHIVKLFNPMLFCILLQLCFNLLGFWIFARNIFKRFFLPIFLSHPVIRFFLRERFLPSWFSSTMWVFFYSVCPFVGRVRHNFTRQSTRAGFCCRSRCRRRFEPFAEVDFSSILLF